jgi:K319-like protein
MKRILPILALAAAATLAGPAHTTSATARPTVRSVAPVAEITGTPMTRLSNGKWRYVFSGSTSYDPDGTIVSYYWTPAAGCAGSGTYSTTITLDIVDGDYCSLTLTVTDNSSATDSEAVVFIAGDW